MLFALLACGCTKGSALPTEVHGAATSPPEGSSSITTRAGSTPTPQSELPPPSAVEPTTTATVATASDTCVADTLARLTLRQRIGQALLVSVGTTDVGKVERLVRSTGLGGVYVDTPSVGILKNGDLSKLTTEQGIPLLVAIDEEGGRVQRTTAIGVPKVPSAHTMGQAMTPQQIQQLAFEHGQRLRTLGVNLDFAPVVDVGGTSGAIGDRSFADDPETVTRDAGAFALGLLQAGVLPTYKHFPGHGRAVGDSHNERTTSPSVVELQRVDLLPYRSLLGDGDKPVAVMIGHLDVPGLTDPNAPATISPAVINGLLRTDLGFKGLVFTDELSAMKAISDRYGLPEAARLAIAAGADVPIWTGPGRVTEVLDHLERSVENGSLSRQDVDRAATHVLQAKAVVRALPC